MDFTASLATSRADKHRMRHTQAWLGLLFGLLLSACGGGGGGPGVPTYTNSPTAPSNPSGETPDNTGPEPETSRPQFLPFILAFDSDDKSILFRSSLTSAAAITAVGGTEEPNSANIFDATLGMRPSALDGGVPGARFSFSAIPGLADLPSGQLSIEVERRWLAVTDPEARSVGNIHFTNEHLLSHGTGPIQTVGKLYLQTDQRLLWLFRANEHSRSASYVNTARSSRFARITLSWTPTSAELYIDGLRTGSLPRTALDSDNFSTIYIGNLLGSTTEPFSGSYYVRNLIVSSKPVMIDSAQSMLAHIMLIGDSFVGGTPYFNVPNKFDGTIPNTIIKKLITRGAGFSAFSAFSNGGGQIQDNGSDPLELDAGQSLPRSDVLTQNPSLIVFITGGNDTSIFDSAQFTNDLHDHIEAFLGANGHPQTTTQHVIVTTTTSNLNANHPATLQMRQIMLGLPTWWNNTYPSRAGAVSVVDTWSLFGGSQVDSTLFGIADPIHPAASGNIVYGEAIADEIIRIVQNQ